MMKRRISIHIKAILTILVALFVFSVIVPLTSAPIPGQLYGWYVVTVLFVILLYVSSSEHSWEEFVTPFRQLLLARTALTKPLRIAVFIAFPLLCGWYFSSWAAGAAEPPGGLRVIHPTPPSAVDFKGKRLILKDIKVNPLRADAAKLPENIEQGRQVYYKNCFFCHGDHLAGQGHFAKGFNPPPADFQNPGTIAQLSESFLFWRIAKGGPGLPSESAPWDSAMPVWENFLSENEIWQVILYLYDRTHQNPRVMDHEEGGGGGH
jgi:mono/diheme cytochrome c family protein